MRSLNGIQSTPRRPRPLPEGTIPLRRVSYRQKRFMPPGEVVLPSESTGRARSADERRAFLRRRLSIGRRKSVHENVAMSRARTNSISQPLDQAKTADDVVVKHGRWNILGGFFTKKTTGSALTSPSNQSRNNSAGEGKGSLSSKSSQLVDTPRGLFRGRSRRGGAEARRPSITRPRTAPIRSEDISKPLPIPGVNWNMRKGSVPLTQATLDVEIPRVRLERYSVMFGDVLEPNTSTPVLVGENPSAPPLAKSEAPRPMVCTVSEGRQALRMIDRLTTAGLSHASRRSGPCDDQGSSPWTVMAELFRSSSTSQSPGSVGGRIRGLSATTAENSKPSKVSNALKLDVKQADHTGTGRLRRPSSR